MKKFNVRKTAWQLMNLLQKLHIYYDYNIASTGSYYFEILGNDPIYESFTIRISNHGQVYGNPKFCIGPEENEYKDVKKYLIKITKEEKEYYAKGLI